jgi:putative DNA primase/helicase
VEKARCGSKVVAQNGNLPNLTWRIFGFVTSEHHIDDRSAAARQPGERVRCLGIRVPRRKKGGIFDRVPEESSRRELAKSVEKIIELNYGVAMPAFHEWLAASKLQYAARARAIVDEFVEAHASSDPWEMRFARKFGIVLAGAILGAESGVAPWDEAHARRSIAKIYRRARKSSLTQSEAADSLLSRIRQGIEDGRFPLVKKGGSLAKKKLTGAWGVRRRVGGRLIVALSLKRLERLVGAKTLTRGVLALLESRGVLSLGADGKRTRQLQIKCLTGNARERFVCLKYKMLPI